MLSKSCSTQRRASLLTDPIVLYFHCLTLMRIGIAVCFVMGGEVEGG